ncbi:restriction endonuclease subunit S [Clostridium sp. D2Q-14]|uniref:restriction endonuclease subunit S n=1 Tax=Anaeromonas gelatinilytica TaxID=2683194 RepID=UPI00193C3718|nr:restriction endonuclease subunit S [Anaeromonas gelatinilytica]MBS4535191.1 restriction endonuclease subunit S [Anaeromonas gelatinilytica]
MEELKYRNEEEMKESSVEWLGKIPRKWELKQLKYLFTYIKGKNPFNIIPYKEGAAPYITTEFLRTEMTDKYVSSTKGLIKVKENDLLLLWDGANAGEFFIGKDGVLGSTFVKFDINTNDSYDYLKYFAKSYEKYLRRMTIGMGIPHVNSDILKNLNFVKPNNILEQQKIANFLDIKTSQFDSIIFKKEKLIEKLKEAKKSLISEVVTGKVKIVDGEMIERKPEEMKDSGIQWLGMIPKDWEVKRLKYLMEINPPKSEVINKNIECSFVPMNMIHNGIIETEDKKVVKDVFGGYTYFRNEDIIMAKVTPCYENGDIAIARNLKNGIGFGTTEINVFRVYNNTEHIYYLMQESHFVRYGSSHMTGVAGLKRVPTSYFENYKTGIPSIKEQNEIAEFLNEKIIDINNIITKNQSQIQKLKEAKQSLISEAVTGKIDLREWEIKE